MMDAFTIIVLGSKYKYKKRIRPDYLNEPSSPNLYMAAEVKRKNYPLRIGFQLFFLLPFFATARIDLEAFAAFRLLLSTVSVRR